MRRVIRTIADLVLPKSIKPRKLRFGLAKGAIATIDFRYDLGFYFGLHEPELWPHYRMLLKRGMRCFDVGMYRGWDALAFSVLTNSDVVSFDCNPVSLEMAAKLLEPSKAKVRLVESFIDERTTIDAAAARYFQPDFIKIDIEGGEASALRGASRLIETKRPALVIETHGQSIEAECVDLLQRYGYKPMVVDRRKATLSEARSLVHNRWLVCSP